MLKAKDFYSIATDNNDHSTRPINTDSMDTATPKRVAIKFVDCLNRFIPCYINERFSVNEAA